MHTIEQLREKIQQIDSNIIESLAQRLEISKQIGQLKIDQGKAVTDSLQERKLFNFYEKLSEQHHLHPGFIKKLFKIIILYSKTVQKS